MEILVDTILPKAVSLTDGIWAVTTKTELQMTQVCSGKSTTLGIFPPLTTLEIPARTYIQQLCEDTGCNPEDLPEAMNDREKWRERVRDIRAGGAT